MSAYANQVKSYIERYQAEVGGDGLLDPHAVAECIPLHTTQRVAGQSHEAHACGEVGDAL